MARLTLGSTLLVTSALACSGSPEGSSNGPAVNTGGASIGRGPVAGSGGRASSGGAPGTAGGTDSGGTGEGGSGGSGLSGGGGSGGDGSGGTDSGGAGSGGAGTSTGGMSCMPVLGGDADVVLQIDPAARHQVIDGFGASDAWSIDPLVKKWVSEGLDSDVEGLADLLFDRETGIGLSAWRFNIGAGSQAQGGASRISDVYRRAGLLFETETDTVADAEQQSGQIRILKEAFERGVQDFVAFSNSPPTYLTKNGLAHPGDGTIAAPNPDCPSAGSSVGSTNLCPEKNAAFATFLVKVLGYLRNEEGVPVNYVSPINEPTWDWQGQSQEGNRYNVEDIKSVYTALQQALIDSGLSEAVEIDGTEVVEYTAALGDSYASSFLGGSYTGGMNATGNGSYKNFIDEFLGDSAQRDILGNRISMHGYFSDAWADRMGTLRDLVWENLQATSPGAKVWMTEVCILGDPGDVRPFGGTGWNVDDMQYALHVGKMIHRDMTRLNASAWHWWLSVTPYDFKDGLLKTNGNLDAESLQTSKVFWTLGQFSRFIRPGFTRVALPGVDALDGMMASAYIGSESSELVVVVVNASESEQNVQLEVPGSMEGEGTCLETFTTNSESNLDASGHTRMGSAYPVPAQSIVTFRGLL